METKNAKRELTMEEIGYVNGGQEGLTVGAANKAIRVTMTDMRAVTLGLKGTDGSNLSVPNQVNA